MTKKKEHKMNTAAIDDLLTAEKNEKAKKSNAPKKTSREDLYGAIEEHLPGLQDLKDALQRGVDSVGRTKASDVSLSTIDDVQNILSRMDNSRKSLVALKKILDSRARSRLSGG